MIIQQVTKSDLENCIKVINALKVGEFKVNGPDLVALSDAIKWLSHTAQLLSQSFQASNAPAIPPKPSQVAAVMEPKGTSKLSKLPKAKKK